MSTAIPQASCLQVLRSQRSESQCSQPMGATYPRVLWRVCAIRRHPQSRSLLAALHCVWIVMIRFAAVTRVSCFQVQHSQRSDSPRSQLTGASTRLSSPSTLAWRHTRESAGVFATSGVTHSLARRLVPPHCAWVESIRCASQLLQPHGTHRHRWRSTYSPTASCCCKLT